MSKISVIYLLYNTEICNLMKKKQVEYAQRSKFAALSEYGMVIKVVYKI